MIQADETRAGQTERCWPCGCVTVTAVSVLQVIKRMNKSFLPV